MNQSSNVFLPLDRPPCSLLLTVTSGSALLGKQMQTYSSRSEVLDDQLGKEHAQTESYFSSEIIAGRCAPLPRFGGNPVMDS